MEKDSTSITEYTRRKRLMMPPKMVNEVMLARLKAARRNYEYLIEISPVFMHLVSEERYVEEYLASLPPITWSSSNSEDVQCLS